MEQTHIEYFIQQQPEHIFLHAHWTYTKTDHILGHKTKIF